MKLFYKYVILLTTLVLVAACSASSEEALAETETAVGEVANTAPQDVNEKNPTFEYYMPTEFSIVDQDDFNIVFSKGNSNIILFVNPNESADSKDLYNKTAGAKGVELEKTWAEDKRFSYLVVKQLKQEDNKFEIVVGVGGVKLTTEVKASDMASTAKLMMEVAQSVEINNEEQKK